MDRWCLPDYNNLQEEYKTNYDNVIGSLGLDDVQQYIRDIEHAAKLYGLIIGTCFVIIFLYNWFLRCFAEILTWIAIFAVAFGLFALGWFVRDYAAVNYVEGDTTQRWLNIAAYTVWALLAIYLLYICCMYYSIKISVRVLKTSSKIITRNLRMVIVPLIGFLMTVTWVCFSVYFLLWVMTCGEVDKKRFLNYNYYTYQWTDEQKGYIGFSVFYFFWVTAFLMALG